MPPSPSPWFLIRWVALSVLCYAVVAAWGNRKRSAGTEIRTTTDEERGLYEVLSELTPEERSCLLGILSLPHDERVAKIGRIYQSGGPLAEFLIDLEADQVTRITLVAMLNVLERQGTADPNQP